MELAGRMSVGPLSSGAPNVHTGGSRSFCLLGPKSLRVVSLIHHSMGTKDARDELRSSYLTTSRHLVYFTRCAAAGERRGIGSQIASHQQDHYELLGVAIDASSADIRKAYRLLQKKYHPDVAGLEGHAIALLVNEAYETLMDGDRRAAYDAAHSYKTVIRACGHGSFTGMPYSTWQGPDRPQGIFVDENACVGCRECVFVARNTFGMDESGGSARVRTQWGDPDQRIKIAIDACPVNCIHYVEKEDLPVLEYLIRPQPRVSNGVFGGGWERPTNVFMAARAFQRRMKDQAEAALHRSAAGKETPAQQKARQDADLKMRAGAFWRFWSWTTPSQRPSGSKGKSKHESSPWKKMFGRASTSELLHIPVISDDVSKVVATVQDWALTFASSSELPLPMPFRADALPNGVQLNLMTLDNGMLSSIGSLVITVEQVQPSETEDEAVDQSDPQDEYALLARRLGNTGSKALPGEGRILQLLREALAGDDSAYTSYRIHRH